MTNIESYLHELRLCAQAAHQRVGVVVSGDESWIEAVIDASLATLSPDLKKCSALLGNVSYAQLDSVDYRKGDQLLGQELLTLVYDCRAGFDANSFSAALGALKGGGLLVVIAEPSSMQDNYAQKWLCQSLGSLISLKQHAELPPLPKLAPYSLSELTIHSQQTQAIEGICRVVEGHRKRPFVLTADRGRGKSSALGMAVAKLMSKRELDVIVTAPLLRSVAPVFEWVTKGFPELEGGKGDFQAQGRRIRFMAPDELIREQPNCDLLLVDEAAAIPIPMLKRLVEQYHRLVFSTTVHGYEGSGRGFTLKFLSWLNHARPSGKSLHIDEPIRWAKGDKLERWMYQTFLLGVDIPESLSVENIEGLQLEHLSKSRLFQSPSILAQCFALLVNAHYQTAPSDLMLMLESEPVQAYAMMDNQQCIGCILAIEEGGLDTELVDSIQLGKRRPKGHLVAASITSHYMEHAAATEKSLRVMRIAVHPSLQGQGIGSLMLSQLKEIDGYAYLSTSFGATNELVDFWLKSEFVPVKLGTQRDKSSGTYSVVMVNSKASPWVESVNQLFYQGWLSTLRDLHNDTEPNLVRSLWPEVSITQLPTSMLRALENYAQGGSNYEAILPWLRMYLHSLRKVEFCFLSDLMVRRVVQGAAWAQCASELGLPGRKAMEKQLREELLNLANLQCKGSE
ncbi:tRNA(Met) cytidine acetyltransferase TmcA [Vibrio mexicanus]|uniref:tRNA(Met) cytidine acetyltransferase TmcA n=1 Tax=Vibrio mexicanus TaxID=1004326 RepID=UPI00063C3D4A|nr:GNAT family N-acetyltransferase [Vibrio mexicanus]